MIRCVSTTTTAMFPRAAVRTLANPSAPIFFSSTDSTNPKVVDHDAGGGINEPYRCYSSAQERPYGHFQVDPLGAYIYRFIIDRAVTANEYVADQFNQALEGVDIVALATGVQRKAIALLLPNFSRSLTLLALAWSRNRWILPHDTYNV
ncbi:hypothetical protein PM082_021332 [Marasmius tenuissimus]|nr:hypothetical protein PM082_021332 [Marasmius tenuissimus]